MKRATEDNRKKNKIHSIKTDIVSQKMKYLLRYFKNGWIMRLYQARLFGQYDIMFKIKVVKAKP